MQAVEAAVQQRLKSNLSNFMQMVFEQVKQSAKAYELNVEANILSLRMASTQDIRVCEPALPRLLIGYVVMSRTPLKVRLCKR